MTYTDINTTYQHNYDTCFIIDDDENFKRISELNLNHYERIFVIIDSSVNEYYGSRLFKNLEHFGKKIISHTVEAAEAAKSIGYYPKLVEFFEGSTAGRYDAVIAVGGGIIIDLVSFTVSTYMRGMPFFIIATTLIGQTDASTAGKTCLNSEKSKNLLGTFFYPQIVYNNVEMLRTNSKRILRQGLSEAFKYSLLTDGELLEKIILFQNEEFNAEAMKEIVYKTIQARIKIRKIDALASNLGHTFGHAIERYFNYEILHGDAITIGTVMAINYAVRVGLMESNECCKIMQLMQAAHLNLYICDNFDAEKLVDFMRHDKKSSFSKLHLVMLEKIGKPYKGSTPFYEADYTDVEKFLGDFIKTYQYKKENYVEYLYEDII